MRKMTLLVLMLIAALAFGGSFECRSDHDDDDDDDPDVTFSMVDREPASATHAR